MLLRSLVGNRKLESLSIFSRFLTVKMDTLKPVQIDEGRCKYVLIKVDDKDGKSMHLVRAYKSAAWHADIFEPIELSLLEKGLEAECVGGGRIERSFSKKKIYVFGYSQAYGQADHNLSCELIKKEFPEYEVTWSNEGY